LKEVHKLGKKMDELIQKLETEAEKTEKEIGDTAYLINKRQDGKISLQDLELAFEKVKRHLHEDTIKDIIKKLEFDAEGFVSLQEVYRVLQELKNNLTVEMTTPKNKNLRSSNKP
jgi:Ca2+-binding EF-hand superfamily protein